MELLLNLIWIALAIGSFVVFMRRQRQLSHDGSLYWGPLLALACVLLLLFPVISASDDLHPTQALMEEATKRVQHVASPPHLSSGNSAPPMLAMLPLLGLLLALVQLQPLTVLESEPCRLDGHGISSDGRGPPFRCN
jgi:4-amino-4-deoxy-L-arabinose transferase-like glycosyltransferase